MYIYMFMYTCTYNIPLQVEVCEYFEGTCTCIQVCRCGVYSISMVRLLMVCLFGFFHVLSVEALCTCACTCMFRACLLCYLHLYRTALVHTLWTSCACHP